MHLLNPLMLLYIFFHVLQSLKAHMLEKLNRQPRESLMLVAIGAILLFIIKSKCVFQSSMYVRNWLVQYIHISRNTDSNPAVKRGMIHTNILTSLEIYNLSCVWTVNSSNLILFVKCFMHCWINEGLLGFLNTFVFKFVYFFLSILPFHHATATSICTYAHKANGWWLLMR